MCPRCGKAVYAAEKVVGGGNVRTVCCYLSLSDYKLYYVKLIQEHFLGAATLENVMTVVL